MKISLLMGAAAVAWGLLAAGSAQAAEIGCADINFTGGVVAEFPNAKEFCIEVAERDAKAYALFKGEVRRVRGGTVYLRFKRPEGTYGDTVSFTPPASYRVKVDGRSYSVRNLNPGQELNVWIPEDTWELVQHETAAELAAATTVESYPIETEEDEGYMAAATLPSTASPWPLVALLGTGLAVFGGLVGWYRRRLNR